MVKLLDRSSLEFVTFKADVIVGDRLGTCLFWKLKETQAHAELH